MHPIVRAVVEAYLTQHTEYSRGATHEMANLLEQQSNKLSAEIDSKKTSLEALAKKPAIAVSPAEMLDLKTETDPMQPTFHTVTPAQLSRMIDEQMRCDNEYLEAFAYLEATKAVRVRDLNKLNDELEARAVEEFEKDARVAAQIDQIAEYKKLGEPGRDNYEKIRTLLEAARLERIPRIRKRLAEADRGALSEWKVRELEVAAEKARKKKDALRNNSPG